MYWNQTHSMPWRVAGERLSLSVPEQPKVLFVKKGRKKDVERERERERARNLRWLFVVNCTYLLRSDIFYIHKFVKSA